jgi:endonuclease/exonuclease/phosphatase family metal-dependent hydrolase
MVTPGEPDQRIDYVWTSPSFTPLECKRVFAEHPVISDHYGIYAVLALPT